MKAFLFFLAVSSPSVLLAQTNVAIATNPPATTSTTASAHHSGSQTNVVMRGATEIFSDRGDFDLNSHVAIYTGNVRVIDPQMKLTCEVLTARVPEGSRVDHIVAERNVVIDAVDNRGSPVHATAQKAVYNYQVVNSSTNETIELTGDPHIQTPFRSGTGDVIIWDRINNTFYGTNVHTILQQPVRESATNHPTVLPTTNSTP